MNPPCQAHDGRGYESHRRQSRSLVWTLVATLLLSTLAPRAASPAEDGTEPYRSPELAAAKSLLIPGWGQHSNGQSGKGWAFLGIAALGAILAAEVVQLSSGGNDTSFQHGIGWSLLGVASGLGAVDAHRSAGRLNRENGYDLALRSPRVAVELALLRLSF